MITASDSTPFMNAPFQASVKGTVVYEIVRNEVNRSTDFRLVELNGQAAVDFAKPADAVLNQLVSTLFLPAEADYLIRQFTLVIDSGRAVRFEMPLGFGPTQSADPLHELLVTRLGNHCVTVSYDNSTANGQQQQQTELLDRIIQTAPSALVLHRTLYNEAGEIIDFQIIKANHLAFDWLGFGAKEGYSKPLSELIAGFQLSEVFQYYIQVAQTGEPARFERKIGQNWYEFSVARFDKSIIVTVNQTSERKQVELALKQQTETFTGVLQAMRNGMSVLEIIRDEAGELLDFSYQYISHQVLIDTGLTREQMIGNRMLTLFPSVKKTRFWTAYEDLLATGEPQSFEVSYPYDGYDNHLLCQVTPLDDKRIISSYQLINELKQIQHEKDKQNQILQRANRDLEVSNENLQQFAYVASHDLQEPLRKIQAFGDLLTDRFGTALGPDGTDMLTRMQVAAKRMSLLIRDLLAYSRVSTQQNTHRPVALNSIISEVLEALYVAIQESGAEVTVAPLPTIVGDPLQLNQLFQNLLGNAIKFRRPNTVPIVRVSSQRFTIEQISPDIRPKLSGNGSFVEITVSDTGIGFDAQYAERIFQVFQRLHGRNNYAGSGIGLSICRRVAENHGGTITASSTPGQGATFRIYLPG